VPRLLDCFDDARDLAAAFSEIDEDALMTR
jgi:hypothetical protein